MLTFSLNTFLKLCLLNTGDRISEVQKRLSGPGGYNFYRPLQSSVRAHCKGQYEEAQDILDAPANRSEREHNRAAYENFDAKFGSIRSLEALDLGKNLDFPEHSVSIFVDPLFEYTKAGARQAFCLWPTSSPEMTQRYGAVACYIMRRTFTTGPLANCSFNFSDLVSNRNYSERQISNNTSLIFSADLNSIGTLVKDL